MAEVVFVDSQALAATDLGETDSNSNWLATDPSSLSYGNNGFHLDFSDAANPGADNTNNIVGINGVNFRPEGQTTDSPGGGSSGPAITPTAGNETGSPARPRPTTTRCGAGTATTV